jgi:sec-independent protein translocase protein TatA
MFGSIGFAEIAVVVVLALLFFGGSRMADLGKGLGDGVRNFRKAIKGQDDEPAALPETTASRPEPRN